MKLLFSYDIFYLQKYGGISSYFSNLAKEFIIKKRNINISCKLHKNYNLKILGDIVDGYKINYPYILNNIIQKVNNFYFEKYIKITKPKIIHYTYFNNNFNRYKNINKIINCWDLTHEKFNENSTIRNLKKKNFTEAKKIICPSYKVKKDLMNYYDIDSNKIAVTYFSSDYQIEEEKKKILQDYILYVGSRSDYKNFEKFVEAFSKSKRLKRDFKILIFGGEKHNICGLNVLEKYKINLNRFKFVSGSNEDLKFYYKNVRLFIYPSLYEGFGIPLIESMRMGCPIISSNGGALEEIGGNGLVYFDPLSAEDIKNKIEDNIYDDYKLKNKIIYGFKRSKKYSWKKCATETYRIYNSLF